MVHEPMQTDGSNIDACIHRFEYTYELFWRLLKKIVESEGGEAPFPKIAFQAAYQANLIDNENIWLAMLQARNLTTHTYNVELADKVYNDIKHFFPVIQASFKEIAHKYHYSITKV